MTIERRLEQLERQNERIECKNRGLTAALTLMAVAICAVVTMAATGEKDDFFGTVWADTVVAGHIVVANDAGEFVVSLGTNDDASGLVRTFAANDKELVRLGVTTGGKGTVTTFAPSFNGKELVELSASDNGGLIYVFNKIGEDVVQLRDDEYGNGVVGAYNRKGRGNTLQPGP